MKKIVLALMLCGYGLSMTPLFGAASDDNGGRKRAQRPTSSSSSSSASSASLSDDSGSESETSGRETEHPKRQRGATSSGTSLENDEVEQPQQEASEKLQEALNLALYRASESNNIIFMSRLLEMGADVNALSEVPRDEENDDDRDDGDLNKADLRERLYRLRNKNLRETPLIIAANKGNLAAVRFLLARGADVRIVDPEYLHTALHKACNNNDTIAAVLLAAGAEMHAETHLGNTPLHFAAMMGRKIPGAALLNAGANVNYRNHEGKTPLFDAAKYGYAEVVAQLLAAGADVNVVTPTGKTPLSLAVKYEEKDICHQLLVVGVSQDSLNSAMYTAGGMGLEDFVQLLLESGASVHAIYRGCGTPLERAFATLRYCIPEDVTKFNRCAQLLVAYGATTDEPEHQALLNQIRNDPETIKLENKLRYKPSLFERLSHHAFAEEQATPSTARASSKGGSSSTSNSSKAPAQIDPFTAERQAQDAEFAEAQRIDLANRERERAEAQALEVQKRQEAEELRARQYFVNELPARCPGVNGCRNELGQGAEVYVCQKCGKAICPEHYGRRDMLGLAVVKQCSHGAECVFQEKIIDGFPAVDVDSWLNLDDVE